MSPIFQKRLLDKYIEEELNNFQISPVYKQTIQKWIDYFQGKTDLGEANLEQSFNQDFFHKILGYNSPPADQFNFLPKRSAHEGRYIPDFIIGYFSLIEGNLEKDLRKVIGELKGPEIDLDKINISRKMTPVEQAFEYGKHNGVYVDWIIVSNMKTIRLYKNTSISDYEEFIVNRFIQHNELSMEFWKFYFLLHKDYLLGEDEENKVNSLLLENIEKRIALTDDFYRYYRECFLDLYKVLLNIHVGIASNKKGQLEIAQSAKRLLHRGLMVCFMSDHPNRFLPKNILDDIINTGKNLPLLVDNKIYP
jgi:hypothetical protein